MPSFIDPNMMLTGLISTPNQLALTWDTSSTGATYNGGLLDTDTSSCSWNDINNPNGQGNYDPNCWAAGVNTNAAISGLGFDVQLSSPGGFIGPWTATFAVYGATPGCNAGGPLGNSSILSGTENPTIDCFDYRTGQMTDPEGNDASSPCLPSNIDINTALCAQYSDNTVQLLGTITVNSDSNGDPAFFGFTTSDPYGIGALVMTGDTLGSSSDNPDANFAIDEQTLLTPIPPSTPEPATLLLFGSGLLLAARRLRKQTTK